MQLRKLTKFACSGCNVILQEFEETWKSFQSGFTKHMQSNFCYGDNCIIEKNIFEFIFEFKKGAIKHHF